MHELDFYRSDYRDPRTHPRVGLLWCCTSLSAAQRLDGKMVVATTSSPIPARQVVEWCASAWCWTQCRPDSGLYDGPLIAGLGKFCTSVGVLARLRYLLPEPTLMRVPSALFGTTMSRARPDTFVRIAWLNSGWRRVPTLDLVTMPAAYSDPRSGADSHCRVWNAPGPYLERCKSAPLDVVCRRGAGRAARCHHWRDTAGSGRRCRSRPTIGSAALSANRHVSGA